MRTKFAKQKKIIESARFFFDKMQYKRIDKTIS